MITYFLKEFLFLGCYLLIGREYLEYESWHFGVFFSSSDDYSCKLYQDSGWTVVSTSLIHRTRFEGWRVRETVRMLSTINDDDENGIRQIWTSRMIHPKD